MLVLVGVAKLLAEPEAPPPGEAGAPALVASAEEFTLELESGLLEVGDPDVAEGLVDGRPVVEHYAAAIEGIAAPETFEGPRWVRHRVRPRERVSQIAARYGVRKQRLIEWNHLNPQKPFPPKRRRSLKVLTRVRPAGRFEARYIPAADESWGDIAARMRVEIPDLRAWNWRVRRPHEGKPLVLWVDPAQPWTLDEDNPVVVEPLPEIPDTARSIGTPQKGKLKDGLQLPASDLYTRGQPWVLWGSSHTIRSLVSGIDRFRRDTGYSGELVIGSMSRKNGRRLAPHKSHQSGRDVDIRLPRLPGVPTTDAPNPDEIDWYAAWGLIRALSETGEVSMIFLEAGLHRRIYEAARVMGETPETMLDVVMWPTWKNRGRPLVRHASGHDGHIHVRFKCGPDERKCKRTKKK